MMVESSFSSGEEGFYKGKKWLVDHHYDGEMMLEYGDMVVKMMVKLCFMMVHSPTIQHK